MGGNPVHSQKILNNNHVSKYHTQEVCTRVFYNSNYARYRQDCPAKVTVSVKNQKTIRKSDTLVGITTKPKPLSKNLCTSDVGIIGVTRPADNCENNPTSTVEVGKGTAQQTIDGPGSAGKMSRGEKNVVTPAKSNLTCHTEVSNIECHTDGTKQIPEKQHFLDQLVNSTEVLNGQAKVGSNQGVSKQHSVSSIVEDTGNTDAADDHLMLLFDINNACDTDKLLTRRYKDGTLTTNCSVFTNWEKQSQFNFGFIPLSNFIAPLSNLISKGDFTPFEAHKESEKVVGQTSCTVEYRYNPNYALRNGKKYFRGTGILS